MSNLWRPWDTAEVEVRPTIHDTGAQMKHVTIGEHEKRFVVECYNLCHVKDWKDVLLFAKSRIIEAGLPDHIVHMYLKQSTERLTGRMRNIIKTALRSSIPSASQTATSTGIDETPALIARQTLTKYSEQMTPSRRKAEAVKRKLGNDFAASSSESAEEDGGREEKKRKIDHTKEAQLAHQKMCAKAMDTMDSVKELLEKVDKNLDKVEK